MRLPNIDSNGGKRTYFHVQARVTEITSERHWKNFWLKKTNKFKLIVETGTPTEVFVNYFGNKIDFIKKIFIHDFKKIKMNIGEVVNLKIGYADQEQQYWHGVNIFSVSILKENQTIDLI